MSLYALQKMCRDVNRFPDRRAVYLATPDAFVANYEVTDEERSAFLALDVTKLYALGVHGLLLRPFTILHKMPEPDYLDAIRRDS